MYLPGSEGFLTRAGQLAEGLVFVDFPGAEDVLNEEGRKLYAEFTGRFGSLKSWSFAFPSTFEAFRAIHQAIQSGEPVKEYLHKAQFQGIFGPFSFDQNGDVRGISPVLRVIRNSKAASIS